MQVLLLTLGTTPQIVTETVYALATRENAFVPDEIHLATTLEGSRQARLKLLGESNAADAPLASLCNDLGIRRPKVVIHVITTSDGKPIDDIRSVADQDQAANQILALVRSLTESLDSRLHVSLAGGRKTMGFYLAYALSLYGRESDELSHVLVNAPFESHPDFFYPPSIARILKLRDGKTATTDDATITLAPIPYVRLRGLLPDKLIVQSHTYREIVSRTQTRIGGKLQLVPEERTAYYGGEQLKLSDTRFVWLYWFAIRAINNEGGIGVGDDCKSDFMACAHLLAGLNLSGTRLANIEKAFDGESLASESLQLQVSRLNDALSAQLGPRSPLFIVREGRKSASRYRLSLAAESIQISNYTLTK